MKKTKKKYRTYRHFIIYYHTLVSVRAHFHCLSKLTITSLIEGTEGVAGSKGQQRLTHMDENLTLPHK